MESNKALFRVLVLADSRGRDLEKIMNKNNLLVEYRLEVHPGASISALARRMHWILEACNNPNYQLVVILGGICSITKIRYMPYRAAVPVQNSVENMVAKINTEFDLLYGGKLATPILLAPTVGIDLVQYAGHWSEELYHLQPLIDRSVLAVNKRMREINDSYGLPTPNTSSSPSLQRQGKRL